MTYVFFGKEARFCKNSFKHHRLTIFHQCVISKRSSIFQLKERVIEMQLMLDAGHGFDTPGKRSPDNFREYEFNRAVAQEAKKLLANYENVTVYFAHSDSRDVPLEERTNLANKLNVDCYISIHANAYGSSWNEVRGIETYVYPTKPAEAMQLARKIQYNLISSTSLPDRGIKTADFHVLRETKMTAVLVECGFMTNQQDATCLRSESYQKTCAVAIVKALVDQYQLRLSTSSAAKEQKLYKVQVGAFTEKKYADQLAQKLIQNGYNAFIYLE